MREGPQDDPRSDRLARSITDLLNELRVAGTGIEVMFAFLVIVPFNAGWKSVSVRSLGLLHHAVVYCHRAVADRPLRRY